MAYLPLYDEGLGLKVVKALLPNEMKLALWRA